MNDSALFSVTAGLGRLRVERDIALDPSRRAGCRNLSTMSSGRSPEATARPASAKTYTCVCNRSRCPATDRVRSTLTGSARPISSHVQRGFHPFVVALTADTERFDETIRLPAIVVAPFRCKPSSAPVVFGDDIWRVTERATLPESSRARGRRAAHVGHSCYRTHRSPSSLPLDSLQTALLDARRRRQEFHREEGFGFC